MTIFLMIVAWAIAFVFGYVVAENKYQKMIERMNTKWNEWAKEIVKKYEGSK